MLNGVARSQSWHGARTGNRGATGEQKRQTKHMTYNEANERLTGRNSQRRKVANNTYLERRGAAIALRLHATDIIVWEADGSVKANSGGWKTPTTKGRLNEYLPHGYGISQRNGQWYWGQYRPEWTDGPMFTDGDSIAPDGQLKIQAGPDDLKAAKVLRRKVNEYAKLYAASLPLPLPSNGDCWYCSMHVCDGEHKGKPLGDVSNGADHLLSHIDEGYVVPSLAVNAMKEAGYGLLVLQSAFDGSDYMRGLAKSYLPRAVRKYIFKRIGQAK